MLLCIDFQPAYAEAFSHAMKPLRSRLNRAVKDGEEIHFIYNQAYSLEGEELGDPLERVIRWGRKSRLKLDSARLIQKNFGWVSHLFRGGYERTVAISILRHLMRSGLPSSAEIPGSELERIVATSHDDFQGFWDCSPEAWEEINSGAIAMPYHFEGGVLPWIESLGRSITGSVEVTGGFRTRCLDEMCMLLEAGGIPYHLNGPLIYDVSEDPPGGCGQETEPTVLSPFLPLLSTDPDLVLT
jgi:hypothetical protein